MANPFFNSIGEVNCLDRYNIAYIIGKSFENSMSRGDRKEKGVFYTPFIVVSYMVEKLMENVDLVKNPYIKIMDPACGAGYFLLASFYAVKSMFEKDYEEIIKNRIDLKNKIEQNGLAAYIVENILWAAELDYKAVNLAKEMLIEHSKSNCSPNIFCCDSLISNRISGFWQQKYDFIIGNPPYIGHKGVDKEYKTILQNEYKDIYKDKSDISYCFYKKGIDLLKDDGVLIYISSRYFIEGPSSDGLRKYITDNCSVLEIIDFFGYRIFKDAGVSTCIIILKKEKDKKATVVKKYKVEQKNNQENLMDSNNFNVYEVKKNLLRENGWLLLPQNKVDLYNKIEQKGTHTLQQLFDSYQGIITGCDKAFVVTLEEIEQYNIEKQLLKPWIKNSSVQKKGIEFNNRFIIYSDSIIDENKYPNALKFISMQKEKLMQRRECINGVRKWYQLQWGRKDSIFKTKKIIYPYKAGENRFAVDETGYYCSADVYSLVLKKEYNDVVKLEYIAAILNSKLFNFYFSCFGKKINKDLYDYYPNTVLKIKIDLENINSKILEYANNLKDTKNEVEKIKISDLIDYQIFNDYDIKEADLKQ